MEVCGQHHAPAALTPVKYRTLFPIDTYAKHNKYVPKKILIRKTVAIKSLGIPTGM
jgi:hypothetical protein